MWLPENIMAKKNFRQRYGISMTVYICVKLSEDYFWRIRHSKKLTELVI